MPAGTATHWPDGATRGWPASPGRARGVAVVARGPDTAQLDAGSVLVCERASPGWAELLGRCAAMVSERGSSLSHVAIVARELAVPYVSGVAGACSVLAAGQLVEVDGTTGVVRVVD